MLCMRYTLCDPFSRVGAKPNSGVLRLSSLSVWKVNLYLLHEAEASVLLLTKPTLSKVLLNLFSCDDSVNMIFIGSVLQKKS